MLLQSVMHRRLHVVVISPLGSAWCADAIVKNMLLHSRHGSGEHQPVDINGYTAQDVPQLIDQFGG
jgi:hypothetical protein